MFTLYWQLPNGKLHVEKGYVTHEMAEDIAKELRSEGATAWVKEEE